MYAVVRNLLSVFPNSFYYARKKYPVKDIVNDAKSTDFTDVMIINEDRKQVKHHASGKVDQRQAVEL